MEKIHTVIEFDKSVWLEGICFCMTTLEHKPCDKGDIKVINPPRYKWDSPVRRIEFEISEPLRPIAIAFYNHPTLHPI